jgi:RNA polymerase sigma factor (sigma-70 family)
MESASDSELMAQVANGESARLAVLFERYHLSLFRYLLHLSGDRALSEDLVQDAFMRVLKYAASYNRNLSFSVWLFGIARNAYFDTVRKRKPEVAGLELDEVRSNQRMPEDQVSQQQEMDALQQALRMLPENKREILILSRFQNMRHQEIARLLDCEVGTVKVRIFRALKDLRERFCELRGEQIYDV